MADTVAIQWIYPPDMQVPQWDEKSGSRRVVVKLVGVSDGTGETDVVKVDLDLLKTPSGNVPKRTAIESVQYHVFGMTCVLKWDRSPQAEIIRINQNGVSDSGEMSWKNVGGYVDPGSDDGTGDILLTTTNCTNGDNYDITLSLRLKD